jgi:hypothetical protein
MGGLEEKVFGRLPDATWIYPGHGKDSTLGGGAAAPVSRGGAAAPGGVARAGLVERILA